MGPPIQLEGRGDDLTRLVGDVRGSEPGENNLVGVPEVGVA